MTSDGICKIAMLALAFSSLVPAAMSSARPSAPSPALPDQNTYYSQSFSTVPLQYFPGGTYKVSNTANFPTSASMSGSLVNLTAGGMREPHWHDPVEWAYVITGTCRATLVDVGKTHPVESWDFQAGDVWYFPSNIGHSVLGLGPSGCSYISIYNNGAFDELYDSKGLSSWLSTAPPEIVAQALNISQEDVEEYLPANLNNFMPLGNLERLTANQDDAPLLAARASLYGQQKTLQTTKMLHRYPLGNAQVSEVDTSGGNITLVDKTLFPISEEFAGALVYAAPNSLRQMHWHVGADEWEFVLNGTVELGVFNGSGQVTQNTLKAGDVGFAPRGAGHWLKTGDEPCWLILVFNNGLFTDVESFNFMANFPVEQLSLALSVPKDFVQMWGIPGVSGYLPANSGNYSQLPVSGRQFPSRTAGATAPSTTPATSTTG